MTKLNKAFTPVKIGPLTLRNRFIKAATNEGMAKKGLVTKALAKFHSDTAKGGVGMSTVATMLGFVWKLNFSAAATFVFFSIKTISTNALRQKQIIERFCVFSTLGFSLL